MFRRKKEKPEPIGIGSTLNSRYRLENQLGQGGAGVIYKAIDEQLGRVVAIKLLTMNAHMAADNLERFRVEARSVARLNHPNIITLYDYAETDGQPYLVMEYIPGQDLWELDNNYSPKLIPLEESVSIIDGILAALEYSHKHGVIHRDLKPENIMITPERQVIVMDFGLARIQGQSRLTQQGLVAGTASYLAPELAQGETGDNRADLYAVGVIMYELFAGRRPFSGDDPLTIISQHIHAPVVPPQHFNADISDALQVIILKLLSKQPDDRYSTAAEVRKELLPALLHFEGKLTGKKQTTIQLTENELPISTPPSHEILLDRISRGKIVGREGQLTDFKRCWNLIRLGDADIEPFLLIYGEAGIGKTRLLREFQVYTGLRDGHILYGVGREYDSGTPYAIFANAISNYIDNQPADSLRRQAPGFIAGEVVKLAPNLSEKIGYIPPNPVLEPEAERSRLLEQVSRFILNIAYDQPTLLVLDDLHFADPGSLDILSTLILHSTENTLLIVGSYRDVALSYSSPLNNLISSLETGNMIYRTPLRRLSLEAVRQMLEALLGDPVSEGFANSIYQATEGNPLFIEEVIKGLATDGQLILREGHWTQRATGQLHVPGSIRSVLGGRLNLVKKPTLELLQLAAVIGRVFNLDMLTAASLHTDEIIQASIKEALQFQLIEMDKVTDSSLDLSRRDTVPQYHFQHALIRETLYEELRPLRRRQLHRKVAAAMEKMFVDDNPAVLAHHFVAGAEDEKAVPYLRQVGEAACQVYANAEAIDYMEQAREILEDIAPELAGQALRDNLVEQFELLSKERNILDLMGDRARELNALERLLVLADSLKDDNRWVEAMSRLAVYYWQIGDLTKAEESASQALIVARQNNDKQGELSSLEQIARVLWTWRKAESMSYAMEALSISQELGDRWREGRLTELVGNIYADTLNNPEQAAPYFNQALEICREIGNRFEEAWILWGIGRLYLFVDDYTGALKLYNQAKNISEDIGSTLQLGWDLYYMGDAWYNLGDYEQALDSYKQAQLIFNASNHKRGRIYALISLGIIYMFYDRMEEAGTHLEEAMQQAEERQDLTLMFKSYEAMSTYCRLLGEDNLSRAIRLGNRVIKMAVEGSYYEHDVLGYYLRGAGFFEMRDLNEACKSSTVAVEKLDQLTYLHSSQISAAEIYYEHSRILTTLGQVETARAYLQKAYNETIRKANFIKDDQQRDSFLNNILLNQTIINQAHQKLDNCEL